MKKTIIRILALVLTLAFAAIVFCSCGTKETFTVGFDADFPPYGYVGEDGEYTGFDIELAREVAKRNGWEIKLKAIVWDSKDFELSSGAINCIWNGFTMNSREDDYTWSKAYVDNSQVIVVKTDSGITDFTGLAGMVVATQSDSSALAVLTSTEDNAEMLALAATFKELKEFPDYNAAFLALESGSVNAIAMDVGVAKYQLESRKAGEFKILDKDLAAEQYGIGFLKGNTELCEKVSKTLSEIMKDGTYKKLADKYGIDGALIWD